MELTPEQRDQIYQNWENYYSQIEINISHCYKWLRDDYVSIISNLSDSGKNVVIDGSFRSGKSSLAIYFAKLKELGRIGKMKKVAYLDMVNLDKRKDDEYTMSADFDFEKAMQITNENDIIILDELYYTGSLDEVVKPLITDYPDKDFVVFLHSDLRHQSWNKQVEEIENRLDPKKLSLISYSMAQEDMMLAQMNATREEADKIKRTLDGNRVLYNTLMHAHFEENKHTKEMITIFEKGFHYSVPYFPQDIAENYDIVKRAASNEEITQEQKQKLFDFGILSRRYVCGHLQESIPAPIINKVAEQKVKTSLKLNPFI